jgi:hypothetical protein
MLAEQSASGRFLGQREKCFTDEKGGRAPEGRLRWQWRQGQEEGPAAHHLPQLC